MVDTLRANSGFFGYFHLRMSIFKSLNDRSHESKVDGPWTMGGANEIIKLVQLEVHFEFFLLWSSCTNVIKGAELSTGLSVDPLYCIGYTF